MKAFHPAQLNAASRGKGRIAKTTMERRVGPAQDRSESPDPLPELCQKRIVLSVDVSAGVPRRLCSREDGFESVVGLNHQRSRADRSAFLRGANLIVAASAIEGAPVSAS